MELKHFLVKEVNQFFSLLIVPYGIETWVVRLSEEIRQLLIVPYGIETASESGNMEFSFTFNRTLWN